MNESLERLIRRLTGRSQRLVAPPRPTEGRRWPEPQDDAIPPRNTEIPPDGQHDGRPPHMNPSRPG